MLKQTSRLVRRRWLYFLREFSAFPPSQKCLILEESPAAQLLQRVNSLDLCRRNYAKNRDIKKDKNKKGRFFMNELKEYFDVEKMTDDFHRPLDKLKQELTVHGTLRSSAGAIENQKIEFEGQEYMIQDLAEVGKKNPRLYVLDFAAFPSAVTSAVKVLQKSELNLNVQQEGTRIMVPIPKVTKEHRQLMVKRCKLYFIKCKEEIRDVQIKYVKCLSKIDHLGSDDIFRLTNQLTALGDAHIDEAEEILKAKQKDLLNEEDCPPKDL